MNIASRINLVAVIVNVGAMVKADAITPLFVVNVAFLVLCSVLFVTGGSGMHDTEKAK